MDGLNTAESVIVFPLSNVLLCTVLCGILSTTEPQLRPRGCALIITHLILPATLWFPTLHPYTTACVIDYLGMVRQLSKTAEIQLAALWYVDHLTDLEDYKQTA